MNITTKINQMLYKKIDIEFDNFYEYLRTLPPEKIMSRSQEITVKESLIYALQSQELLYYEAKALLSLKNPLEELYQEWKNTRISHIDFFRNIIEHRVEKAMTEQKRTDRER